MLTLLHSLGCVLSLILIAKTTGIMSTTQICFFTKLSSKLVVVFLVQCSPERVVLERGDRVDRRVVVVVEALVQQLVHTLAVFFSIRCII